MHPAPAARTRRAAAVAVSAAAALAAGVLGGASTAAAAEPSSAAVAPSAEPAPTTASAVRPTVYGAVVKPRTGETWPSAMARAESTYGRLGEVRFFDGNAPDKWPVITSKITNHPAIISFKYPPAEVLTGQHDAELLAWFRAAPTNRRTWYSYIHEPEDNIARGEFTAADYRAAWTHVAALSHSTGNRYLRSTLILMCYTVNPTSHRNWLDYFPGKGPIDVLGWDCYNHNVNSTGYDLPQNLMGNAVATSKAAGMPWGIAEVGSLLHRGDDGTARGQWLTDAARYLANSGAVFVNYFDSNGAGADYRLLDAPSQRAWHDVVSDQNPF